MILDNLKISTRLNLGFGLLLALLVGLAAFGLHNLNSMRETNDVVTDDRLPKLNAVTAWEVSVLQSARHMGNVFVLEGKDDIAKEIAALIDLRKERKDFMDMLVKTVQTDEGKAALKAILDIRVDYLAAEDDFNKAVGAGEMDGAKKIALERVQPLTLKYVDTVNKFVEIQKRKIALGTAAVHSTFERAQQVTIGLVVLALAIAVTLIVLLTRSLTRPAAEAVEAATRIAEGDLTLDVLTSRRDEMGKILQAMQLMQRSLRKVVGNVRHGSDSIATASAEIAQGNSDLSSRTEEQASALEQTAASMEQLGSTVRQNADNAKQANQLAMGASTVATQGGEVVGEVVETMKGINASSKKISDIISVIDGIAFQTNILALNAAVEAARAGEQGRGFAVVASEVRNLAGRSAEAAKEIKALINASVERVEQGSLLVDKAGATMTEVVTAIRRVTDIMGEISAASNEQSAGVAQIGEAVTQMDHATQQNAALVEESAAAAESLRQQAGQLVQTVAVFRLDSGAASVTALPATALSMKAKAVDRRGANRATNVVRPAFKPAAAAVAGVEAAGSAAAPAGPAIPVLPPKTGTDDWEAF